MPCVDDSGALPPIQQFLARVTDARHTAITIAVHAFQRARLTSHSHGQIEIIDVDGRAEDLVRVRSAAECDG